VSSCFHVDKEMRTQTDTMARFVMQDHKDPRAFTIVERYENEGSQK
jgi:hypothetical protein